MPATSELSLYPVFDRMVSRAEKETHLRQRSTVVWFYGLSGSGKSTLALALERQLFSAGVTTHLLDGDNVRTGLNRDLGFSEADRTENLRRIAEVAKLFVQAGVVVLCAFITPLRAQREAARAIIGEADFIEVYVDASWATCAARDPKGLYAKALAGGVAQFTGRDAAFEPPLLVGNNAAAAAATTAVTTTEASGSAPTLVPTPNFIHIATEQETPAASLQRLLAAVHPRITFAS